MVPGLAVIGVSLVLRMTVETVAAVFQSSPVEIICVALIVHPTWTQSSCPLLPSWLLVAIHKLCLTGLLLAAAVCSGIRDVVRAGAQCMGVTGCHAYFAHVSTCFRHQVG